MEAKRTNISNIGLAGGSVTVNTTDAVLCNSTSTTRTTTPCSAISQSEFFTEINIHSKDTDDHESDSNNSELDECANKDLVRLSRSRHSTSEMQSISTSVCRYCYVDLKKKHSVSSCHCNGSLCKECLVNEAILTYNRSNRIMQCTVCQSIYDVSTDFSWDWSIDFKSFFIDSVLYCGLKDERHLLTTISGKIGYTLVIFGVSIWIISTSLLFAFPPDGIQIYLFYMVGIFDLAVGISTLWFIMKCRWFASLSLSLLYLLRCLFLLFGDIINMFNETIYKRGYWQILIFFVSLSFIAFLILTCFWIIDLYHQYTKYKINHQRFKINGLNIKVTQEMHE